MNRGKEKCENTKSSSIGSKIIFVRESYNRRDRKSKSEIDERNHPEIPKQEIHFSGLHKIKACKKKDSRNKNKNVTEHNGLFRLVGYSKKNSGEKYEMIESFRKNRALPEKVIYIFPDIYPTEFFEKSNLIFESLY